jgi:hypothetical protein
MDVLSLSIRLASDLDFSLPSVCYVESVLHHDFPETEEHCVKRNHCARGSVKDHISLPLIFHVTSCNNLKETEDVPSDE